jgi:hypothetical protein
MWTKMAKICKLHLAAAVAGDVALLLENIGGLLDVPAAL